MKVLLVEDDAQLSETLNARLRREGYVVDVCSDGECGLVYALTPDHAYDVVLLDRMLPILDGISILRAMRAKGVHVPVILLTGLSEVTERVEGLDHGADDYVTKPFDMDELLARIRALTRRPAGMSDPEVLMHADVELTLATRMLSCGEQQVRLTKREAGTLATLMRHPAAPLSRDQIIMRVWGTDAEIEPGNVDNYISFLRRRLVTLASRAVILTIHGAGYQLGVSDADD